MKKTVTGISLALALSALGAVPAMSQGLGTGLGLDGGVGTGLGVAAGGIVVAIVAIENADSGGSTVTTTTGN